MSGGKTTITVIWPDLAGSGLISIPKILNCGNGPDPVTFTQAIRSLVGLTPTVTQPNDFCIGTTTLNMMATMNYPNGTAETSIGWALAGIGGSACNSTDQTNMVFGIPNTNLDVNMTVTACNSGCPSAGASIPAAFTVPRVPCINCGTIGTIPAASTAGTPPTLTIPCGTTQVSSFITPPNSVDPATVTYDWKGPNGWTVMTLGPNALWTLPAANNIDGDITVRAIVNGRFSSPCSVRVRFRVIDPSPANDLTLTLDQGTVLCSNGIATVSNPSPVPAVGTTTAITWSVQDAPGSPPPPPFGPGLSVTSNPNDQKNGLLSFGSGYSGRFVVVAKFTHPACSLSDFRTSSAFQAGRPFLYDKVIDGFKNQTSRTVCPGSHWTGMKARGNTSPQSPVSDPCVAWVLPVGIAGTSSCNEADIYLPKGFGGVSVIGRAFNVCGVSDQSFFFLEKQWGCEIGNGGGWSLLLAPNPATDAVTIQLAENGELTTEKELEGFQIFNETGLLVRQIFENGVGLSTSLGGLPDGKYIIRTIVDGIPIAENLLLKRD